MKTYMETCMKTCIYYSNRRLLRRLSNCKVHLCLFLCVNTYCTVDFRGDQISWILLSFLSMIIYEVLYAWCLRYNICSAWFLDIRISSCFYIVQVHIASYVCTYITMYSIAQLKLDTRTSVSC